MKFTLTHLTGSRAGSVQELTGHLVTVGRDPSNSLAFDPNVDAAVSGFHANLTVQGPQVLLSDLGSSNGTLVNGTPIQGSVPLVSGCTIQFGDKGPIVSVQFAALASVAAAGATTGAEPTAAAGPGGAGAQGGAPQASGGGGAALAGGPGAAALAGAPGSGGAAQSGAAGGPPPEALPPAQPKPPSAAAARLKGCGLKVVGTVVITLVLGAVCYVFRGQIQRVVPPSAQRYLKKIPGVSLIFSKAKSPTQALPPAARDAKRMLPKPGKTAPQPEEQKSE